MDKKINYRNFDNAKKAWIDACEKARQDAIEILKEEESINLSKFPIGNQPYHFISIEDNATPAFAHLDEKGRIEVEARSADGRYFLSWEDMEQDIITLTDFMEAIYGVADDFDYED